MLCKDRADFKFTLMDDEKRALSAIDRIEAQRAEKKRKYSKRDHNHAA